MKRTNGPFQLEQTVPGAFFFQGLAGGMLAGFLLLVTITLWADHPRFDWLIFFTPFYLVLAGTIGVLQATLIWGTYRLTRIQLRALARVAITIFCIGLIAFLIALKQENVNEINFAIGAGVNFLIFLPVALLVGSSIKPWEFFTFGSIATGKNANRLGSKSVLATLGTLPLRFMSFFALAFWVLTNACERERQSDDGKWVADYTFPPIDVGIALVLGIPVIYLLFSLYVSFRSPRKTVLLISGLAINIPLGFIAFYSNVIYIEGDWWSEAFYMIKTASTWFLIAWGPFLASRLSVRLNSIVDGGPVNALQNELRNQNHHCLGSRFLKWQSVMLSRSER
jgi:hypothetical protein